MLAVAETFSQAHILTAGVRQLSVYADLRPAGNSMRFAQVRAVAIVVTSLPT